MSQKSNLLGFLLIGLALGAASALSPEVRARLDRLPAIDSLKAQPEGRLPAGQIYHVTPRCPKPGSPRLRRRPAG